MVVTLAGARKQEEEERICLQKEKDSQVRPSTVETELAETQAIDAERECAEETPEGCILMMTCSVVADLYHFILVLPLCDPLNLVISFASTCLKQ